MPRSAQLPLPLQFVNSDMHIRPSNWSLHWSLAPVKWQVVTKAAEPYNCDFSCDMLGGPSNAYRYCQVMLLQQGRVQQLTGRIGWTIGTTYVRQVSCWTNFILTQ